MKNVARGDDVLGAEGVPPPPGGEEEGGGVGVGVGVPPPLGGCSSSPPLSYKGPLLTDRLPEADSVATPELVGLVESEGWGEGGGVAEGESVLGESEGEGVGV